MTPTLKGIIMTLLSCIVSAIATGIPTTAIAWEITGISVLGTMAVYVGQSFAFPSTSILNQWDLKDLIKGVLVTLGNGLSTWAASEITSTSVNWKNLLIGMGVMLLGYLSKQFKTPPSTIPIN